MNAAVLILVILVSKTDCFVLQKTNNEVKEETGHGIVTQNIQNPTNSITWSEILANVLINSIRLLKNPSSDTEVKQNILENNPTHNSVLSKFCSQILYVYKHYIYDKFFQHDANDNTFVTKANINDSEVNVELNSMELTSQEASNDFEVITLNPDVEIITPEYHGRLCSDCEEKNIKKKNVKSNDCPEGLVRDAAGNCGDPKSLNFITSVPQQCPIGYKRDWFGYCKPIF